MHSLPGARKSTVDRRKFLGAAVAATVLCGEALAPAWRRACAAQRGGKIGLSLNIGLNNVDNAGFYQGGAAPLSGCQNDAKAMRDLAERNGFEEPLVLFDDQATYREVKRHIIWAGRSLKEGDTFLCTFSSHGTGVTDENGDEDDGQDEAWCLYDNLLIDDEFYSWCDRCFHPGVRLIVVIDACHSGSAVKALQLKRSLERGDIKLPNLQSSAALRKLDVHVNPGRSRAIGGAVGPALIKSLPETTALEISRRNATKFAERTRGMRGDQKSQGSLRSDALLLAACRDNELASDGGSNGVFTFGLLKAMQQRPRNYRDLFNEIERQLQGASQHPNYLPFGKDAGLEGGSPFTV